ncbi:MAG: response regulator [bacterium]
MPDRSAKRILVVEDEPAVLEFLKTVLVREGYDVILAADGGEALNLLTQDGVKSFDLVITDLQLPNVKGVDLFHEVLRQAPKLKVILITGYGAVEEYLELMNEGAFEYLNKPIRIKELLSIVHEAIGAGQVVG